MYKSVLLTLAAAATVLPSVSAFCCSGPQCADGTGGTPCCATQSCNIFCCACGGVCRSNSKRDLLTNMAERSAEDPTESTFHAANVAGDGKLTMDEYLAWANTTGKDISSDVWEKYFNKFDKDNKGYVTMGEVSGQ